MQSPTIVFDHINKMLIAIQPGPSQSPKLAEAASAQREQVTTSSGVPANRG